jgi:phytoene dehydrogenase-like protein
MPLDAFVVGAGPNGLAAAITLARAGRSVRVLEAAPTPGGGTRTAELTLPGYLHDVCSAIHPLAAASPFFRSIDLAARGVELIHPEVPLAHPLDGDRVAVLFRSLTQTADALGDDGRRWRRLVGWPAERWERWAPAVLGPIARWPAHPLDLARFGARSAPPVSFALRQWETDEGRALFTGLAAHSFLPMTHPFTAGMGLTLGAAAHYAGWPLVAGGSHRLTQALVGELESLGGEVVCDQPVRSLSQLREGRVVLFDLQPAQVLRIAGPQLSALNRARYRRFRVGPGVFKLDYALSRPIPWANSACGGAGTVHVGGTFEEIARGEAEVGAGRHPEQPFVLVAQQSRFDPTRAPDGGDTLWAYCHVPNGSTVDMTDRIERQIERFAPGFRDTITARHHAGPAWFERHNENNIGGDISGGSHRGTQLVFRPGWRLHPYRTSDNRLFICSSSTPPGGGVHGLGGYHAAQDALATALA